MYFKCSLGDYLQEMSYSLLLYCTVNEWFLLFTWFSSKLELTQMKIFKFYFKSINFTESFPSRIMAQIKY